MNIYRHGDILLKSVKSPKNLKLLGKFKRFVLAEGETTGHRHLLTAEPNTTFEVFEDEKGLRYLKFDSPAKLTHEEHNTIEVMPDWYVVGSENEYNYFELESQRVVD